MQTEQKKLTETETEMKAALQLIQFIRGSDVSNNQDINYTGSGSKLISIRDEDDHRWKQARIAKKKIKFRFIIDLYKCTDRLSPVEDEYNWSFPVGKDPNMNISAKEDSSIKTNKKNEKILKYYPEVNSDGEIMNKMGCVNKRKFRSIIDIYETTKPIGRNKNKY